MTTLEAGVVVMILEVAQQEEAQKLLWVYQRLMVGVGCDSQEE